MRRTILAVILIGVLIRQICGSLDAQQALTSDVNRVPPAQVKVGVVNLTVIFLHCERSRAITAAMDRLVKPFHDELAELDKSGVYWTRLLTEQIRQPGDAQDLEKARTALRDCRDRKMTVKLAMDQAVQKKLSEEMAALEREVCYAIEAHAVARGYHLILAHGDPKPRDPSSIWETSEILRKLSAVGRVMDTTDQGSLCAMYCGTVGSTNCDLTGEILQLLNTRFHANQRSEGATSRKR